MIRIDQLNKAYERRRGEDSRVLRDVSFQLPDTGFVCILGPSGCGKTSLLNAIGGLDRFDSGSLSTGDTTVSRYGTAAYEAQRNRNFGYIFQNYYLLDQHSVAYNVYLGLHSLELSHREKLQRVRQALQAVDMDRYIRRKVSDLSGGQQQRVAIARALARRPRVIFADEPTGNLDEANTMHICSLLRRASRSSLVIMVTHEERIAKFFADRILRLDQGQLVSDSDSWDRGVLQESSDKEVYAGDLEETRLDSESVSLRLLATRDAPPVELTVVAAGDRIILKLSDSRTVTLSEGDTLPRIREGKRPVMTLEMVDRAEDQISLFRQAPDAQCRSGKGLGFSMLAREARQLTQGKGLKKLSMRIFLVLLSVLTLLTVADFITISKVDPRDFITTDSHILTIKIQSGGKMEAPGSQPPQGYYTWFNYHASEYVKHIAQADTDFDFIPLYSQPPKYTFAPFYQLNHAEQRLPTFSYVPLHRLSEQQLLCGRMPANSEEVVVDRILLDAILQKDGILQNSITDYTAFLGEELDYGNKGMNPVIVGVCDSGERSIYATTSTLYALSARGSVIITVSELQQRYPGQYEVLEMITSKDQPPKYYTLSDLTDDDCVVNVANAGVIWRYRLGQLYGYAPNQKTAVAFLENPELLAHAIVTDHALEQMIMRSYGEEVQVWCADKDAMRAYLETPSQLEAEGYIQVTITDEYAVKYAQYQQAATIRADGRTIVTATVLALCVVMLYLLCRTRVNERLGMIAVYRLLGIPKRKLYTIFLLEGSLSALVTVVPAAVLTWLGVLVAGNTPELGGTLELPWQAAAVAALCILGYYLLVTVLPLFSLLRDPPARLAARYDM